MRLSVMRVGDGPHGTLLLHGYLGSGRNLWSLARRWSERDPSRTFLLPDLTGHGTSPRLGPGDGLDELARDILATAETSGLKAPWTIVGHSLGGWVSLVALAKAPERISRVVLLDISPAALGWGVQESGRIVDAFAKVPSHFARREEARTALDAEGLPRPMVDWLLTNLIPEGDGYGWRVDRQALLDLRRHYDAVNLWPVLAGARGRVSCVRGAQSGYVPDQDAARMESLGCPVTTIEGAGHFLHVDQPAALLEALQTALGVDPAGGVAVE